MPTICRVGWQMRRSVRYFIIRPQKALWSRLRGIIKQFIQNSGPSRALSQALSRYITGKKKRTGRIIRRRRIGITDVGHEFWEQLQKLDTWNQSCVRIHGFCLNPVVQRLEFQVTILCPRNGDGEAERPWSHGLIKHPSLFSLLRNWLGWQ